MRDISVLIPPASTIEIIPPDNMHESVLNALTRHELVADAGNQPINPGEFSNFWMHRGALYTSYYGRLKDEDTESVTILEIDVHRGRALGEGAIFFANREDSYYPNMPIGYLISGQEDHARGQRRILAMHTMARITIEDKLCSPPPEECDAATQEIWEGLARARLAEPFFHGDEDQKAVFFGFRNPAPLR